MQTCRRCSLSLAVPSPYLSRSKRRRQSTPRPILLGFSLRRDWQCWLYQGTDLKELVRRFPNHELADEAAYELTLLPTGGECEGSVACYVAKGMGPSLDISYDLPPGLASCGCGSRTRTQRVRRDWRRIRISGPRTTSMTHMRSGNSLRPLTRSAAHCHSRGVRGLVSGRGALGIFCG